MMGDDHSEGSGGSGAGQDGETLVKPDASPPALYWSASKPVAGDIISMHP